MLSEGRRATSSVAEVSLEDWGIVRHYLTILVPPLGATIHQSTGTPTTVHSGVYHWRSRQETPPWAMISWVLSRDPASPGHPGVLQGDCLDSAAAWL